MRSSSRLSLKRLLGIAATLVIVALMVYYVAKNWEDFRRLEIVQPFMLVLLLAGTVINLHSVGKSMDSVLHPLGVTLDKKEALGLMAITRLINTIMPGRAGLGVRGGYLKKKYSFPYAKFVATLAASNLIMYTTSSAFGLLAILFIEDPAGVSSFAILLLVVLAGMLSIFLIAPNLSDANHSKPIKHFIRALNGWGIIRRDKRALLSTFAWTLVNILTQTFTIYASFSALGATISIPEATLIGSLAILSSLIAISPGGIGITEGIVVAASVALGIEPHLALAAALLRRATALLVSFVSAALYSRYLFGQSLISLLRNQSS